MELAELERGQASGSERERAEFFGSFSGAFETMVAWQAELGDMNEVLAAIERGRARSLLDEINAGGANLHIGRTALEREQLRQRETELKSRIATLARQLDRAGKAPDAEKRGLEDQLADARDALYQHYREQRSTSPVYRNLLSTGTGAPRLSQIQRRLVTSDGLLLVYLFGREGGYVLVVGGADARLVRLDVSPSAAVVLGVDSGSLTADRLHAILIGKAKGVLQHLADPTAAKAAHPKLAALWQLLVPEPQRKELTGGRIRRLIVIPDGPLALLPFETLVVEPGEHPRYLLDVGPAILYGPSATVLLNLSERSVPAAASRGEPVLTVGNPAYSGAAGLVASAADGKLSQLAARSRYSALGGKLTQLPYSGWESSWVADAFAKNELKTTQLEGPKATEARVRAQVRGRRIVHLACHGLADQAYGNFYGALALAPGGNPADPADDGLLTLPEIYELDLKGCELAVLSACETNYGPEQRGEGVWTLSRGFLVAGARRVVASNWLVDDEAAASLVSQFCAGVAQGERTSKSIECADALRNAKRWVRQQEKWSSPYYWGTFVLVGPN
jgi:CHAT domain-containing protein